MEENKTTAKPNRTGKRGLELTLMGLPTFIWYIAFCYVPLFGIVLAFKRYRLAPGQGFLYSVFYNSPWVGLENFRFLFINPQIHEIVGNTLSYNLLFLVVDTVLPVALAIGLYMLRSKRLRKMAQTFTLVPYLVSWVVVSCFVYSFLSVDKGIVNSVIRGLGGDPVNWYREGQYWPFILTVVHIWKSIGYSMLIYYSQVVNTDRSLIDSALIDGASNAQIIRHIILPAIKPMIIMLLVLDIGGIFVSDFGLFYQVTRDVGSLAAATETIDVYVYKALMGNANYGFSAAASLVQNVIGCILMLLANAFLKKIRED